MSANEKLRMYADKLSNEQATAAVALIEGYLSALDEAIDDAYCDVLLKEARSDPDQEYEDFEEFAKRAEASWK